MKSGETVLLFVCDDNKQPLTSFQTVSGAVFKSKEKEKENWNIWNTQRNSR